MTEQYTQSKEYLLPLSLQSVIHTSAYALNPAKTLAEQNVSTFLFDAGATLAGKKHKHSNQWTGTEWIFDWYSKRGLVFDHVYAWEPKAAKIDTADLEPALANALHFYNVGISDQPGHEHNPLARIKQLCKPSDIVVFKLDIDNRMELNVVHQLLSDPELMNLIDEFYYEHHVTNKLMRRHGFGTVVESSNLKSWYSMVNPARAAGFRMHYWP